jgi:hypothetical protein
MDLKIHRRLKNLLVDMLFMSSTGAPPRVVIRFFWDRLARIFSCKHKQEVAEFRKYIRAKKITHDYFSKNIPSWLNTFEKYRLKEKPRLDLLEIGSFEGVSTLFLLDYLENAFITCVDTWQGSDEHKDGDYISSIEDKFDANLSDYLARVTKYKGTSFSFFHSAPGGNLYDLVYIDGSHYVNDVIIDAIKGFELLKIGGIMIFDDYLWKYYKKWGDNPCAAINLFLRIKKEDCKLVFVGRQVQIRKIANT